MSDAATILFVSAADGNAALMSDFLADQGYRAKAATTLDGFDAELEANSHDLVLIDADGFPPNVWARCEQLQQQGIPFFVISQYGTPADKKGREYKATRVFEKPVGQDALVATIEQLLDDV